MYILLWILKGYRDHTIEIMSIQHKKFPALIGFLVLRKYIKRPHFDQFFK